MFHFYRPNHSNAVSSEFAEFEIAEFWSLLTESKLLEIPVIEDLKVRAQSALVTKSNQSLDPATLVEWLIEQKALSKYQANIFLGGISGPIVYGNYCLLNRIARGLGTGCLQGNFQARHRPTGHGVVLQFLSGEDRRHLERWQQIDRSAAKLADLRSDQLLSTYEVVALPEHRFVVSQPPIGKPLGYRIPPKTRIQVGDACAICQQIARAVGAMHLREMTHGAISPETVWLAPGNGVQVFVPLATLSRVSTKDLTKGFSGDVRAIGKLLFCLVTGKTLERASNFKLLAKYGAPDELSQVIGRMMTADPKKRIPNAELIVKPLQPFVTEKPKQPKLPATTLAYEQWLRKTNSFVIDTGDRAVEFANSSPKIETPESAKRVEDLNEISDLKTDGEFKPNVATGLAKKRKRKSSGWLISTGVVSASLLAVAAFLWVNFGNEETKPILNANANEKLKPEETEQPVAGARESEAPSLAEQTFGTALTQELIPDDGQTLWETPTTASAIDFQYVPPAPKILFAIRPQELLRSADGELLLKALGPQFNSRLKNWSEKFGLQPEQIQRLTISLHTTEQFDYEFFYVATPSQEVTRDELWQAWGSPVQAANADYLLDDDGIAYRFLEAGNDETVATVLIGSEQRMIESLELDGTSSLEGPMKKLAGWADRERHFNVLFLRTALFNDEGQQLMSGVLAGLNRQAAVVVDVSIRGGLFSMHACEDGTYLELRVDRTLDLKADEAVEWVQETLKTTRDRAAKYLQTFPAGEFWDPVRQRFDNMLTEAVRNTRVAIEDREAVANCWLPPLAIHNLVAASELTLSMAGTAQAENAVQSVKRTPANLMELLATPRDLTVSTSPDLILLLDGLQTEIRDEYPSLPFEFTIRLMGKDLGAEGITQNQRPNDFSLQQKPLSDILTEIMVQANPDKNISGPSDPNCKLVWVVADDPDKAGKPMILITTRKAASENSYSLPDAFVDE